MSSNSRRVRSTRRARRRRPGTGRRGSPPRRRPRAPLDARLGALAPPHDGLDPGDQLLGMAGLGDPVVGAQPQPAQRCETDDGPVQTITPSPGSARQSRLQVRPPLRAEHGGVDDQHVEAHARPACRPGPARRARGAASRRRRGASRAPAGSPCRRRAPRGGPLANWVPSAPGYGRRAGVRGSDGRDNGADPSSGDDPANSGLLARHGVEATRQGGDADEADEPDHQVVGDDGAIVTGAAGLAEPLGAITFSTNCPHQAVPMTRTSRSTKSFMTPLEAVAAGAHTGLFTSRIGTTQDEVGTRASRAPRDRSLASPSMQAVRSAGVRPVLRATGAGVAAALLALLVFVRGLFELLDPVAADVAQVGAGSLIVFAAAALGGAAGAWQAALAGVPTRREIVAGRRRRPRSGVRRRQPGALRLGVGRPGAGAAGAGDDRGRRRRGRLGAPGRRAAARPAARRRAARPPPSTWARSCSSP